MSVRERVVPDINLRGETAKRLFDLLGSMSLLMMFSPLLLLVAILVRLSSPGPIFFRQERVGRHGQNFWLFKFRTMAGTNGGPAITAGDDQRITPIGRKLRRLKLDELPQLWNVLRGDMSLIGPRPEVLKYVRHYSFEELRVLSVRPGITGMSQLEFRDEETLLTGKANVEEFYLSDVMPTKLKIDLRYIDERSFRGDLRLLVRTAATLLRL